MADAEQAATRRQRRRLDDELAGDVSPRRTQRTPQADLRAALEHRDHHHVGDADAADDQRHRAQSEQQPAQSLVDTRPRLERIGRARHVDLVRRRRVDRPSEHAPGALQLIGVDAQVDAGRDHLGAEEALRRLVADEHRAVEVGMQRQRVEDADHGELHAADRHDRPLVEVADAEPLRRNGAEHDHWQFARAAVSTQRPAASVPSTVSIRPVSAASTSIPFWVVM